MSIDETLEKLASWDSWRTGDPPPPAISHRTKGGMISLEPEFPGGTFLCGVYFDGRRIGTCFSIRDAARSLAFGHYDEAIGFSTNSAGVPSSVEEWSSNS